MTTAERVRALLFFVTVVFVYAEAGWYVAKSFQLNRNHESPTRGFIIRRGIFYGLAGLGLLCVAYGSLIEPNWLDVRHIQLQTDRLPAGTTIRIAHFSDLHSTSRPQLEERVIKELRDERPDAIVFTGDMAINREGIQRASEFFQQLPEIAPTFGVRGNWDFKSFQDPRLLEHAGVNQLDLEASEISVRGSTITIFGASYENWWVALQKLNSLPSNQFVVMLYHTPDLIEDVAKTNAVNLYLAGHTHGGQIALPFYGAIITLSKFDKKYESGLHKVENTYIYTTRGVGMEGGLAPRIRFFARPELVIFDISGSRTAN